MNKPPLTDEQTIALESQFKPFAQFSANALKRIWQHRLSQVDMFIYQFFTLLDPFGDRWVDLPPTEVIISYLQISQSSYYKAISKLIKLDFIEFENKHSRFRNRFSQKKIISAKMEKIPPEKNNLRGNGKDSAEMENQNLKPAPSKDSSVPQTIQTIQTNQTIYLEGKEEKNKKEEKYLEVKYEVIKENEKENDLRENGLLTEKEKNLTSQREEKEGSIIPAIDEKNVKRNDPYFNNPKNPNRRRQLEDWIPDGPWRIETKSGFPALDWKFIDYVAHKFFINNFGDSEEQAMAKTKAYFRNDVNRLPEQWEAYQQHAFKATAAIHAGATATGQLKEADKEKLESVSTAFKKLPEYYQTTDKQAEIKPVEAQTQACFSSEVSQSKIIKPATNAQEYRQITGGDDEATLEQKKAFFAAMAKLSQGNSGLIRSKKQAEPKSRLEILNQQLHDPILRSYVLQEVRQSDKWAIEYGESGEPIAVVEF